MMFAPALASVWSTLGHVLGHPRVAPACPAWRPLPADRHRLAPAPGLADVGATLRAAVGDREGQAARLLARIRVAATADLVVAADPAALRSAFGAMIGTALRLSPCAAVLVTARRLGDRIEVSVLADGHAESEQALRMMLRPVAALVGEHGGSTEIDARLDGAVIRVRLARWDADMVATAPALVGA